ncbi:unnamed protein product [Prorocentrum cordatum]|uniref:Uncharacterized protein n=1 Tax=Prorocentrum cordatum TaxID=2364126 RepID=A0ABN9XK83_9DINO|nr:unnamed protein product [Polarella glacialis]
MSPKHDQLRFYLNLVWPPKQTLDVIRRLFQAVRGLDAKRQMLVLRFVIPSLFDFVEWNMGHDRLLKYSRDGCADAFELVLELTRPYLPGGHKSRLTSTLPHLEQLRYTSTCAQCGRGWREGRPGDPNSIWAHKFYPRLPGDAAAGQVRRVRAGAGSVARWATRARPTPSCGTARTVGAAGKTRPEEAAPARATGAPARAPRRAGGPPPRRRGRRRAPGRASAPAGRRRRARRPPSSLGRSWTDAA